MSRQEDRAVVPIQQNINKPYLDRADIVIVGNGIAGLTAAVEARRLAPEKRIVIITQQVHPTINTPALKQFAIGKMEREQLLAYPTGTERRERIHVVTAQVEDIHANSKYVTLSGDRGFGYGSLLLATGSTPGGLPKNIPGRGFDGVLTLHRLQDYLDLRRRIGEVQEAVVVGGGVHAIETVMSMLYWGIRVHWLIRGKTILPHTLDQPSSDMVLERIRHSGAIIHTQTEVTGVVGRVGVAVGVITNQQEMIPCQLVLACTGTQAVTSLAEHCSVSMRHKKGIIVDDQLRTSVRDIYAAGDAAALKNPQTGNYEPRAQWYAAVSQGRIAGAMMAGHEEAQPFGVQWHATHVGELSMLTVGNPLLMGEQVVTLTDKNQGGYRRMAIVNNRLVGYLSLGASQPDSLAIKRIIDEGHEVRDITRALLKGNFDARHYLSQMRSRAAHGILSTGQLAGNAGVSHPISQVQLLPVTGSFSQLSLPGETPATPAARQGSMEGQPTHDAQRTRSTEETRRNTQEQYDEEVSAFTGNLPALSRRVTEEITPSTGDLPDSVPAMSDEVNAFTGNLPVLRNEGRSRGVESTLMPLPSPEWKPQSGLLAYADKTVKNNKGEKEKAHTTQEASNFSHGLWSYGKKSR